MYYGSDFPYQDEHEEDTYKFVNNSKSELWILARALREHYDDSLDNIVIWKGSSYLDKNIACIWP